MQTQSDGFEDVWHRYLEAHSLPTTRAGHYIATVWGVGMSLTGLVTFNLWLVAAGIVGGYGLAIASHYLFERKKASGPWKPLVKSDTVLAAASDFRMFYLAVTGGLDAELRRFGLLDEKRGE